MTLFNGIFNAGLGIAALILLSQSLAAIHTLLYVGATHMIVLAVLAWKCDPKLAPGLVEGLHKAGFLHTLMALAAALIVSSHLLGPEFKMPDLSQVLLPMGAALIPHVVGVWSGQVLGSRHFEAIPALEESVFKKLAEDADAAREVIRGLFQEREQALRQQIASLQLQKKLLEDIHQRSTTALEDASGYFAILGKGAQRATSEFNQSLESVNTALKNVAASGTAARTDVEACRKEVQAGAAALQEAVRVIRDVDKMHEAISDLLSQKLFRKEVEA